MSDRKTDNFRFMLRYFSEKLSVSLEKLEDKEVTQLCEIRLRADRPVTLVCTYGKCFLTESGRITTFLNNNVLRMSQKDISTIFERMCNYSVYSLTQNICEGFITLENGCRVGVYGTAVLNGNKISSIRNIKGMNIRLAGTHEGVSEAVLPLFNDNRPNVLICGPPGSGKTSVLKDLVKKLSDNLNLKIAVVDERYEFEGYYLGYNTDVMSGYPKADGIQIAVRTLSPEIVVCDEIGSIEETDAVISGLNSGVSFVMSIHCRKFDDLKFKKQYLLLRDAYAIDYIVILKEKSEIRDIIEVREMDDANYSTTFNGDMLCYDRKIHRA